MVTSLLGGQTDTVLESSHGNMSAHKNFNSKLKISGYRRGISILRMPNFSFLGSIVKKKCLGVADPLNTWLRVKSKDRNKVLVY